MNAKITLSSGNVFADLGLDNAEELHAKSSLAIHIGRAIKARGLTQSAAARVMGITQPKVSQIINGHLDGYSTDRLMRFLTLLGCDVRINVSQPHGNETGHLVCA